MDKYTLNEDGEPHLERNLMKWARWLEDTDLTVARTTIDPGGAGAAILVSTVFLGLNFGPPAGDPVFFETAVDGGVLHRYLERYTTRAEAIAGHERITERVRTALKGQ